MWLFKVKLNPDGSIERCKARFIAQGQHQKQGIDYQETYALVAGISTVRLLIVYALNNDMELYQIDIKTAFLYGKIDRDLYISLPEDFGLKEKVGILNKSLYGLKQSPRCWNLEFDNFLKRHGLKPALNDRCLYYDEKKELILVVYVDDGLIAPRSKSRVEKLIQDLKSTFEFTSTKANHFLGCRLKKITIKIR